MLLYEKLTYKVRGAIFSVYNTLGSGHKESLYQKALSKELKLQSIKFEPEKILNISYKNERIGIYRPDFVIEDKIIIEIKAVDFIAQEFHRQLLYYLKGTDYQVGLLVNFGPKLQIIRKIWTPARSVLSTLNP